MSRELTVLIDSREKKPFLFPNSLKLRGRIYTVKKTRVRMDAGDYAVEGFDGLVERKASIRELHQNLITSDKRRMKKALDKLAKASKSPVLIVESSVSEIFTKSKYCPNPSTVIQHLFDECQKRGIAVWFVGRCSFPAKRRNVGELVLRALVAS